MLYCHISYDSENSHPFESSTPIFIYSCQQLLHLNLEKPLDHRPKSMFGLDENNNVRETFVPFGECWGLKEKS